MGGLGSLSIHPAELLTVGGPVTLAFLFCRKMRAKLADRPGAVRGRQPAWGQTTGSVARHVVAGRLAHTRPGLAAELPLQYFTSPRPLDA